MTDDIEFKIARLELKPGDVLVIRYAQRLPMETVSRMQEVVKRAVPNNKCLIMENGGDLAVLTAAEIEARGAAVDESHQHNSATGSAFIEMHTTPGATTRSEEDGK